MLKKSIKSILLMRDNLLTNLRFNIYKKSKQEQAKKHLFFARGLERKASEKKEPLFKNRIRIQQKGSALTIKIKSCEHKRQIQQIINLNGESMDIIHLTAILGRIEETQMNSISSIVDFVINSISKNYKLFFDRIPTSSIRSLVCLICYLGNLKDKRLNEQFIKIQFQPKVIDNANNIEKTMIVNGSIRLGLFLDIFQMSKNNASTTKRINIRKAVQGDMEFSQLLSIYYTFLYYYKNIQGELVEMNNYLLKLIQLNAFTVIIQLRQYTYICLILKKLIDVKAKVQRFPRIKKLFESASPTKFYKKTDSLRAHEFTQLCQVIPKLSKSLGVIKEDYSQFLNVLQLCFKNILLSNTLTLKNLHLSLKIFIEFRMPSQEVIEASMQKATVILEKQIKDWQKGGDFSQMLVDPLSFGTYLFNLTYNYNFRKNMKYDKKSKIFLSLINTYTKTFIKLKELDFLKRFSDQQLVYLTAGFYRIKCQIIFKVDPELVEILVQEIMGRKIELKNLSFFYSYIKKFAIPNSSFCKFIKKQFTQSPNLINNQKVSEVYYLQGCLMNLSYDKCLKCVDSCH